MKYLTRILSVVIATASLAAAASAQTTAAAAPKAAKPPVAMPLFGLGGVGVGIAIIDDAGRVKKPSFFARFAPRLAGPEDQSIKLDGTIGVTVNETVPIPGTDMIKAGQVQEGAYSQNNNRNATSEARNSKTTPPVDAAIIVKVNRP